MRTQVIDYVKSLNFTGVSTSTDLPFDDSGVPLYIKNTKRIYVGKEQITSEPLIQTLGATTINNEATSVTVYFTVDAKQLIANYDTIVAGIKAAKDITTFTGVQSRVAEVSTEYQDDLLITSIDITLTRIK